MLLGHAWVGILSRALPKNPVFSTEKAISMALQLSPDVLPKGFSDWISEPESYAEAIIAFCEDAENLDFAPSFRSTDLEKMPFDLRGVRCPLNAVRARIVLNGLAPGEELEILLDEGAPIENVPQTLIAEGHSVLFREKKGEYWLLRVRKRDNTK